MAPIPREYASQKFSTLIVSKPRPHVFLIEMNRPAQMNAFNATQHDEMRQAFAIYASDDDLWVCVVTGTGRAFCGGQDLKEVMDSGRVDIPAGGLGGISDRLDMNKPIIAAVNGLALGGGFELALACDIIIASRKALFGLPEVKVGLAALGGGAQNLGKIVGYHRAMYLAMTAGQLTAEKALEWGVVQEVVEHERLMDRVYEIAGTITEMSPDGVRATKAMARLGREKGWVETNLATWKLPEVEAMLRSENMKEGTTAFVGKRKPRWGPYAKL